MLAAQISASLAWIAVSGEDAPELIATAPIDGRRAAAAKLSAIALPVGVILACPVIALAIVAPRALPLTIGFAAVAGASTALLNFWHPMAGNRRGLLRRHSQSKIIAMAEHGLALLWAVAAVAAMVHPLVATVPLALVAAVLWMFRPRASIRAAF